MPAKKTAPGYSGRSLAQKLGVREGMNFFVINDPGKEYHEVLGLKPVAYKNQKSADIIHLFTKSKAELAKLLKALLPVIKPAGMIWVSWPKKSSKVETEITEDTLRELAYPLGLVDLKVCAVTEIWSGLKLMIRKENR
jgi:hypothetical protein